MSRAKMTPERAVRENLPHNTVLILAVSGGIDSMTLLESCFAAARECRFVVHVAHVDHGLRTNSASDAQFVRQRCDELGVQFHLTRLTPPLSGVNIEAWGRLERYNFLESVRSQITGAVVVTAHHANDAAETLLMRLVSNKELRGIAASDPQRHLVRPFLAVSRSEIERFADQEGVKWCEDSSNLNRDLLRNRVRLELIPFLQQHFSPGIVEILAIRAQGLGEDYAFLERFLVEPLRRIAETYLHSKAWKRAVIQESQALESELRWRLFEALIQPTLGFRIGRQGAARIEEFFLGGAPRMELGGGITLVAVDGGVAIERSKDRGKPVC